MRKYSILAFCFLPLLLPGIASAQGTLPKPREEVISVLPQIPNPPNFFAISPDANNVGYVVQLPSWHEPEVKKSYLVVDSIWVGEFDYIDPEGFCAMRFSPDNKKLISVAKRGPLLLLVAFDLETKEATITGPLYQDNFRISPDSRHIAYTIIRDDKGYVTLDDFVYEDFPMPRYGGEVFFKFSPDSQRFAFTVNDGLKQFVVVDGKAQKPYDMVYYGPNFSPDSKHLTYAGIQGEKWFLVFDGVELKGYDELGRIAFSPDNKHFFYLAREGLSWYLVQDGEARKIVRGAWFIISPDSQHIALVKYKYYKGSPPRARHTVFLDGKRFAGHEGVLYALNFSPDSQHLVYAVQSWQNGSEQHTVFLDGVPHETYDSIQWNSLTFSPDSKHLAYIALKGSQKEESMKSRLLVVNGIEGDEYDPFSTYDNPIAFDSPHQLRLIARRGNQILRLTYDLSGLDKKSEADN